ncbi:restriction endonuclease subunit S [Enterococcus hirae]
MSNDTQPEIRFPGFTDEWEQRKLGELATIVRGASPRPIQDPKWFDTESDVGWLRIADVTEQDGRIYYLEQHISKLGQEKTRVLVEPHLLLSIAATVGKPVVNYVKTGVHDGFLIFLNAIFDREFMFQWLEMFRPKWQKYGQPGSQVNLNSELVRNQEILIPNNEEQQKIGSFFKQLDNTIALHQRKLDLLKETKKGFLQKMFPKNGAKVPEIRFPGFTKDWEQRKLGDFVVDYVEKTSVQNQFPMLTSSQQKGIVLQEDYFANRQVTTENNIGYFVLPRGYFTFRSRSDNDVFVFNRNDIIDRGIISYFYPVFTLKSADSDFFLRRINNGIQRQLSIQAEGTGQHVLSLKKFKNIVAMFPSEEEQQKIGTFFKQLDDTITLHQRKLDLLKETKKGFLQKMFV